MTILNQIVREYNLLAEGRRDYVVFAPPSATHPQAEGLTRNEAKALVLRLVKRGHDAVYGRVGDGGVFFEEA